ncbi:hypothetical protein BDV25DRAFT_168136 [Aspergillus avenaceus]|uniref:Aminoglycoside phosphotransferase domain-containing protein n=1 Tax=Aspergillus avenaceus TaxID=36643 RepID=A0A5N6U612_ASPAV|nr:hypothetical protein BDV25DRAFT_168136 [Aspergillus avenaceus]
MPQTLPLLHGEITYSFAKEEEKRPWIEAIVAHHLNLGASYTCCMDDAENWLHGSFNLCVPVAIQSQDSQQRVLLRLPLPYRVGDAFRPGNGDEKIRCETGAYAWLQENCPDVPIPTLYGFATSTGETYTRLENLPFLSRCFQQIRRRLLSWFSLPIPTIYIRHQCPSHSVDDKVTGAGYLLLEYIDKEQGEMLSNTWPEKRFDTRLRTNLFHDLSKILLNITRTPLPKIGSFIIDQDGFLRLSNRPLSLEIQDLENEKIPTNMPQNYTYSTVDSYIADILRIHDNRIRHQPNAINNTGDYIYQTSALTAMRTTYSSFFNPELRRGPFVFTLTDLHQSNIFVDSNWHITALVDLEWACIRPIEMLRTPAWLTNKAVDEISEEPEEYNIIRTELLDALTSEETKLSKDNTLSTIMNKGWNTGTFWYSLALASPTGLFAVFYNQIQPRFLENCPEHDTFEHIMPWYWARDWVKTAADKLSDRGKYDAELKQVFESTGVD